MKIVVCPLVPRRFAVNLFGSVWARDKSMLTPVLLNHERIHTAQQRELLWLPFYIIYLLEWLMRLIMLRRWEEAYRALSFEREAYARQGQKDYLKQRRHFAQWRRNPAGPQ